MALTVLVVSFTLFLALGTPVSFSIALSCILAFLVEGLPLATAFQSMLAGMNVFSFLAIPFFIFSGEIMLHGGIADKIVNFARNLVGHWRGGLGMANVVACTMFGGISGSAVADVSAMGGVMIPMMKKEGYSADYAVNVTTHAALAGICMPTSHNLIIYAFSAQAAKVSIGDLMFSGILPVIILMICMLVAAYGVAVQKGFPKRADGTTITQVFPGWGAVIRSFVAAMPGMFVVFIILGLILFGVTTATEAAGIAVTYSLCLTAFAYRTLNWDKLMQAGARAAKTTGVILLLIGVSNILQWQMAYLEIPDLAGEFLTSLTTTPWIMFLMINFILFALGTFMDLAATMLICTPIFLPIAMEMGMGPVQFGMVILLNGALGLNTPPVGTTQFVGCAIGGISVGEVMKTIMPFYFALFAVMAAVTYVPFFSTWLPSLIKGVPVH